jgi:penicillin amidase
LWPPLSPYEEVWWRDKEFLRRVLEARPANWLPGTFASYDDLLLASADEAVGELEHETNSADPSRWAWGQIHPLIMDHPFARGSKLLRRILSIGPIAQGGTGDTVRAMGVSNGPAMRFVADLSNFDRSLMEVSTGESGVYSSPYYRDQFEEWFAGRAIVAPFSEADENAARVHHLELAPPAR